MSGGCMSGDGGMPGCKGMLGDGSGGKPFVPGGKKWAMSMEGRPQKFGGIP